MKGYFDNAATTLMKPEGMYEYMSNYMLQNGTNVGRGNYSSSQAALVADTRDKILQLVKAPKVKTVVFTPTATIALNLILYGISFSKSDKVYISPFEHNAVTRLLNHLQKRIGFEVYTLAVDKNELSFNTDQIARDFSTIKPTCVIMSHVNNTLGLIAPVDKICRISKQYGAINVVDGAQACGIVDIDMTLIDYYVFAGHKTLMGPFGISGFICDKNASLKPVFYGGTGIDSANQEMPSSIPEKFEAGSFNLMATVGLNYSLTWFLSNRDSVLRNEKNNYNKLKNLLNKYAFLEPIVIDDNSATNIIACKTKFITPGEMGVVLAEKGVSVRTGLQCAPSTHKFLGTFPEGTVRFSINCFTSEEDFNALQNALDYIVEEI